jgi:nitrite reductase/ring-hydroxylating ferredoxin subunit
MDNQPDPQRLVCLLSDLGDPGSRSFTLGSGDWPLRGFVVRYQGQVHAYLNRCPHARHPLNWQPDSFLSPDQTLIQCSSHGARFEISTGACMGGPCNGSALRSLPIEVQGDYVVLLEDPNYLAEIVW